MKNSILILASIILLSMQWINSVDNTVDLLNCILETYENWGENLL